MSRKKYKLEYVENDHSITQKEDYRFLVSLQQGLLYALQENGMITKMQLQSAEELLLRRLRDLP